MAFTGQQAAGGVQADPACAGQKHLAPGVQVGKVFFGAVGAVHGFHVRRELNQVARHEACGQAQVAQQLHQQPARVAARACALGQRFFRRLHAGLHADGVAHILLHQLVDAHQEVDGALFGGVDLFQVLGHQRCFGLGHQIGGQLGGLLFGVGKRKLFGAGLQEEVERVVHRHFHHQVHRDLELARGLGEHQAGLVVGKRVLLPVDEMVAGLDALAVRQHLGAAVRRGAQAHNLRAQFDQTVVLIMGDVIQSNVDGHAMGFLRREGINAMEINASVRLKANSAPCISHAQA
jgi:hypothetical protein